MWTKELFCLSMSFKDNKTYSNLKSIQHHPADKDKSMLIGVIQKPHKHNEWKVTLLLNKQQTTFKIDTGAQCNIILKWKYHQLCKEPPKKSDSNLVGSGGHKINLCGKVRIQCSYKGKCQVIELEVKDQEFKMLLN